MWASEGQRGHLKGDGGTQSLNGAGAAPLVSPGGLRPPPPLPRSAAPTPFRLRLVIDRGECGEGAPRPRARARAPSPEPRAPSPEPRAQRWGVRLGIAKRGKGGGGSSRRGTRAAQCPAAHPIAPRIRPRSRPESELTSPNLRACKYAAHPQPTTSRCAHKSPASPAYP